jgi:ATP-dependent Lon protease
VAEGSTEQVVVTPENLKDFLGVKQVEPDEMLKHDQIGTVTGLAVTSVGGDILFIEALTMAGKGGLSLTGQLGDVMKESASAAFSYARANAHNLGIDADVFTTKDIHIHIPEGATPKDGPSAGITMATALVSALANRPVRRDVAMTGEITLRGNVLPIGGVKEKVLAAYRAQIKKVLLPAQNRKDMEDVPDEAKQVMEFVFVDHISQVLEEALAVPPAMVSEKSTDELPQEAKAKAPAKKPAAKKGRAELPNAA